MKNSINFNSVKKVSWYLSLSLSVLAIVNCTTDEITDSEEGNAILFEATNASFATPQTGRIYTIRNKNSGRHLDIENKSNSNGANLQQWGTSANSSATHRQWEILSVGNGYVRLKGVDSGKSLEVSGGSNSNGANVQQWEYKGTTHQQWEILSTGSGYYRIKSRDSGKSMGVQSASESNGANIESRSWNGDDKFQWFFTEVGSSNDDDDDDDVSTPPTNSNTPGGILGIDNDDWKLNGFSESPSANADYHDDVMDEVNGNIATWSNNNYFFSNNGFAYFKAYRGMESSSGSGNPRVELRELNNGNNASWNGDNGTHIMSFTVRVDQLPNGWNRNDGGSERSTGTVCFGQIHGPSGTNSNGVEVDDTIRVQFEGTRGQTSGNVRLKISGYITEEQGGSSETFDNGYRLDTEYDVQIIFSNDRVSLNIDGEEIFGRTMNTAGNGSYFKIGSYIQSVQEGSFDGSFGLVGIKNLSITHN